MPSNGARAAIATTHSTIYSGKTVQRTSVGFKLAVRGDSEAGDLVAPLPCTAYFGKVAKLFGCSLPQQALAYSICTCTRITA